MSGTYLKNCPLCGRQPKFMPGEKIRTFYCDCGIRFETSKLLTMDQTVLLWNNRPMEKDTVHPLDHASHVYHNSQFGELFCADHLYTEYGVVTQYDDGLIKTLLESTEVQDA